MADDPFKLMEFKCACEHLACPHAPGRCGNRAVTVQRPLLVPTALCGACAERWGLADADGTAPPDENET